MLKRILDDVRQELLREERRRLGELRVLLVRMGASEESQKTLAHAIGQLDELFLLVVVGEFNSGKSSLINALIGDRVLEQGVTPTTSRVGVLMYGPEVDRSPSGRGFEVITAPLEILREMHVVDTPGTNAVLREHEALTREFVPRADLVLFVTSADRPFTESERDFLQAIRNWGKKVLVALNKIDILEAPGDVDKVVEFVKGNVLALVGFRPAVFPVSARQAIRAKTAGDSEWFAISGFETLEQFLTRTLHETVRLRLKLLNPLGVAQRVVAEAEKSVESRRTVLREDERLLEDIDAQLARQRTELARDLRPRLQEVEKPLLDLGQRGSAFIDETLRLRRLAHLVGGEPVAEAYARDVARDLGAATDKRLEAALDGFLAGSARAWRALGSRLDERQDVHAGRIAPVRAGTLPLDRSRLLKELQREAQRAVGGEEVRAEGRRFADAARQAAIVGVVSSAVAVVLVVAGLVAASGLTQVGALAAGAAFALLGTRALALRRRREHEALRRWVAARRERLAEGLAAGLDREGEQGRQRAQAAVEPYRFFVRSEKDQLEGQAQELRGQRQALGALAARIDALR
jgi:small GTP-binding protein